MASRVGHYLLFDTLGTGTFAKYVGYWRACLLVLSLCQS